MARGERCGSAHCDLLHGPAQSDLRWFYNLMVYSPMRYEVYSARELSLIRSHVSYFGLLSAEVLYYGKTSLLL